MVPTLKSFPASNPLARWRSIIKDTSDYEFDSRLNRNVESNKNVNIDVNLISVFNIMQTIPRLIAQ